MPHSEWEQDLRDITSDQPEPGLHLGGSIVKIFVAPVPVTKVKLGKNKLVSIEFSGDNHDASILVSLIIMSETATFRGASSKYQEYAPPPPLADNILCFWTQSITGESGEYPHLVLPDGCIDIVFINDLAPLIIGPWGKPFVSGLSIGTKIIGARWYPGRAPALLGVSAAELLNQEVPLRSVWSRKQIACSIGFLNSQISMRENVPLKLHCSSCWRMVNPATT